MHLLDIPQGISLVVYLALAAVKLFALVVALTYSAQAYRAAEKWTKPGWVIVLAIAFVIQIVGAPILFLNLGLTVAALVFLADVRPALAGLRRR